jgi:para-aminobenzoate synthetase component I
MTFPIVEPLPASFALDDALARLDGLPHLAVFHSSRLLPELGRYSFLTGDPLATLVVSAEHRAAIHIHHPEARGLHLGRDRDSASDPLHFARVWLQGLKVEAVSGLPPFQGGLAGFLGYEAGQWFERLPVPQHDDCRWPTAVIGLYDWVIAWDHQTGKGHVFFNEFSDLRSRSDFEHRRRTLLDRLKGEPPKSAPAETPPSRRDVLHGPSRHPLSRLPGLVSNFDRAGYEAAVARIVQDIHAGEIFQANLSQRLTALSTGSPVKLFQKLMQVNPAPFAAYFDSGPLQIISASPERFLKLDGDIVETRPIKGTRARRHGPEADLYTRDELRESDKDRAENVMIVDLLRNDLSRVCRPGSIRVPQLCTVETYETVQHLVSEVRGQLNPGRDFFDLLAATFPGGSITGAPKIRAMEIITELEQVPRGPYCGTLFYAGFNGLADSSILIRTFIQADGMLHFPAGGGITAQSNPGEEYEETLAKAEGLFRALEPP